MRNIISTDEPWTKEDVFFFLEDALRRGMSAQDIAGFLRRTVDEVQAKARELGGTTRQTPARVKDSTAQRSREQ